MRNLVFFVFTFLLLTVTFSQECTYDGKCDKHERCRVWKDEGECYKNEVYMLEECPASCADENYPTRSEKVCKDYHERCSVWADLGECEENPINMKRYCPLSCALCQDNKVVEEKSEDCSDTNDKCGYWASLGECSANPNYMHNYCSASCGTCDILKKKVEKVKNLKEGILEDLTDEEKTLIAISADFGDKQHVSGSEVYETLDVIRKSIDYMKTDFHHLPEEIQEKCLNRNNLCSFWVALGECEKNKAFMLTNCAPACQSCHMIDMAARCPEIPDQIPALKPGDLNKMFEKIVRDAPGNRTLTEVERQELQEKMIPEYTVTVHSRPSSSPSIEIDAILDKTLPPWVITIDDFLTSEECKTIIDLGHEAGFERSRDVGKKKYDGTYDGMESAGRTSENAWCSSMKGCRENEVIQRVMDRMGGIMGIPADNSEDLQILRYEKAQFYNSHHDYIPHQRERQCGPRILTFFLYLSDVEAGGGTKFNKLGLTVSPKLGRALLWPSVYDSNPLNDDPRMYHEALPVEAGTKFAANGWFHMYDYITPQSRGCT